MSNDRTAYVVDTTGVVPEALPGLVRAVIELVAPVADRYECDIPLDNKDSWSTDVTEAAEHLASLRPPRRSESEHYRQTGVRRRTNDTAAWRSFVTFAAHAFDATVWDEHSHLLIGLSDEGTSVCAHLTEVEAVALTKQFPEATLVPRRTWRERRRRQRGARPVRPVS